MVLKAGGWLSGSAFREMFGKWCTERRDTPGADRVRSHSGNAESEGLRIGNDRTSAGIRWKNLDERAASERSGSYQDVLM